MRIFLYIFLILIGFNLQAQSLDQVIRTNPPGADVFDMDGNKIGKTPLILSDLKPEIIILKIAKDDFYPIEVSFPEKRKRGLFFPESMTHCEGCMMEFDANSDEKISATIKLLKKFTENNNPVLVGIQDPVIEIAEDIEIGRLNGSRKRLKDKDIYRLLGFPQNMEMKMLNSFEDSYVNAVYFSVTDFKQDVATLQTPKIIVKPVVKQINFDLKGDLLRDYQGKCTMVCDWQIYDLSDTTKILETITTTTSFYRNANNYELLLHEMIALSERNLLETTSLDKKLQDFQNSYLEKSKGQPIEIKLSAPMAFTSSSQMIKSIKSSVVTIEAETKFGSGVFITDNGYIVTNYHVVDGGQAIYVRIDKEKKIKAEIIKINKDFDLAILKVDVPVSKGIYLSNNLNTSIGDEVYAIGTPLDKSLGQTVTKGIVSGYREYNGVNFVQTDVSINSGNSGGPLLNAQGEIIGINTLKTTGKDISGIGFAIPSEIIIKMLNIVNK